MKNAPFLLSTILALVAVILSFWSFGTAQTNNALQAELLKKQTEIQEKTQGVTLQSQEYQRQEQIINTGATLAQKLGPSVLRDMGYFAAKKNKELLAIMNKHTWAKDFIPNAEQLKDMDKAIDRIKVQQGGGTSPTPAPAPAPAPTLRPGTPP